MRYINLRFTYLRKMYTEIVLKWHSIVIVRNNADDIVEFLNRVPQNVQSAR